MLLALCASRSPFNNTPQLLGYEAAEWDAEVEATIAASASAGILEQEQEQAQAQEQRPEHEPQQSQQPQQPQQQPPQEVVVQQQENAMPPPPPAASLAPPVAEVAALSITPAPLAPRATAPAVANVVPPVPAPVPAPVPVPVPVPSGGVWGKDKSSWAELTTDEQAAAARIGYDAALWDAGGVPTTCENLWRCLSTVEQQAAAYLGYTQASWDAEVEGGEAEPVAPPVPPIATPAPLPAAPPPPAPPPPAPPRAPSTATAAANAGSPAASPAGINGWMEVASGRRPTRPVAPPALPQPTPPPSAPATGVRRFNSGMMFGCKRDTYDENMQRQLFGLPQQHFAIAQKITDNTALFLFNYSTRQVRLPASEARLPVAWATVGMHRPPALHAGRARACGADALQRGSVTASLRSLRSLRPVPTRPHPVLACPHPVLASPHVLSRCVARGCAQLHGIFVCNGPAGLNLEPNAWAHHRRPGAPQHSSPYPAQVRWQPFKVCKPIREDLWKHIPRVKNAAPGRAPIYDLWMTGEQAQALAQICLRHGT